MIYKLKVGDLSQTEADRFLYALWSTIDLNDTRLGDGLEEFKKDRAHIYGFIGKPVNMTLGIEEIR